MQTILLFGGTGFIGRRLVKVLSGNYKLIVFSRNPEHYASVFDESVSLKKYDLNSAEELHETFEQAFGVINLSGENIGGGSWNKDFKEKILESRLSLGKFIKRIFKSINKRPAFYFHGSATGYYGINPSDAEITEERPSTRDSFLTKVAHSSEENVGELKDFTRLVFLRTGIVLDRKEGALPQIAMPFKLFIGGPIGSGKQWIPWIHIDDEVAAIDFLIDKDKISGAVNLSSPNPVTQKTFARAMGKALHRPAFIPAPAFALKILLGNDKANDLLLSGLRVIPEKLNTQGFSFQYKTIEEALDDIYK